MGAWARSACSGLAGAVEELMGGGMVCEVDALVRQAARGDPAAAGPPTRSNLLGFLFLGLFDHDLGAVLEFAADGGIGAGDDLLAGLDPALHFNVGVVRDA